MKNEFEGPVSEWMVSPVFTTREETLLTEVAQRFDELGVSALPVLDQSSRLIGVLSRDDLSRAGRMVARNEEGERHLRLPVARVREFMHTRVPVIRRDLALAACARRMLKQDLHRLYVAEDGPLEGVISTREMLHAVAKSHVETALETIADRSISVISSSDPLSVAMLKLRASPGNTVVVMGSTAPVGVFSHQEATTSREADPAEPVELWMDPSVLALPGELPAHRAAQRAHELQARYVIIYEGQSARGIVSGLGFTKLVANSD